MPRLADDVRLSEEFLLICLPGAHVTEHASDTKNFEVITAAPERLAISRGRSYRDLIAAGEGADRQGNVFPGGERDR